MRALAFACAALLLSGTDVDKDTGDRHDRARSSSSSDSGSGGRSRNDDDDDHHPCCFGPVDDDYGPASDSARFTRPPPPMRPTSVDFEVRPRIELDQFGSNAGGRVIHQEGIGVGLALDFGFPYFEVAETHRSGLLWRFDVAHARLLDSHRPEGAAYSSTLGLLTLTGAIVYRYTWLSDGADLSLGIGPGFSFIRAFESFDDGTPDLDETLIAGISLWPMARADFHDGVLGGRLFVEGSVALTLAKTSDYLDQYDSLISGLDSEMITPHLRVGQLWQLSPGIELGLNYDFQVIGGVVQETSLSHGMNVTLRLSKYYVDR